MSRPFQRAGAPPARDSEYPRACARRRGRYRRPTWYRRQRDRRAEVLTSGLPNVHGTTSRGGGSRRRIPREPDPDARTRRAGSSTPGPGAYDAFDVWRAASHRRGAGGLLSDDPRLDPNPSGARRTRRIRRVAGAGRVRRRSARARLRSPRRVGRAFGAGRRGWRRERPMRRDPDGTTGPIRTVACFGDRSTSRCDRRVRTAEVIRGADVEGVRPERASETRTRRVDARRAVRQASTVTARIIRYEGTSMERWTTRARVGDGRHALAAAAFFATFARKRRGRFFIQIGPGGARARGTRAVLAPFDSTTHRRSSKGARLSARPGVFRPSRRVVRRTSSAPSSASRPRTR